MLRCIQQFICEAPQPKRNASEQIDIQERITRKELNFEKWATLEVNEWNW